MPKVPFYIVRVGDTDITNYISSFAFEDCTEEDDLMRITLPAVSLELLDADYLKAGKDIEFQFGYLGGLVSPLMTMRIAEVEPNYGKTIDVAIKALDYGQLMKKNQNQTVWAKKTASEIATEIAQKYGLSTAYIERTTTRYGNVPQANRTDWELLNYLVEIESNGSFHWYIKSNALHFKRMDLEQQSRQVFEYGLDIVSFKPSLKDTQNKSNNKTTLALNPLTKETSETNVNIGNAKDQTLLGTKSNSASSEKEKPKTFPKYNENGKPFNP